MNSPIRPLGDYPHTRRVLMEVAEERINQIERWGNDHDDQHSRGELSQAAASLILGTALVSWPWQIADRSPAGRQRFTGGYDPNRHTDGRPRSQRERLVQAAAMAIAEIERLDRAVKGDSDGG